MSLTTAAYGAIEGVMAPVRSSAGNDPRASPVRILTLGSLAVRDASDRDIPLVSARPKEMALLVHVAVVGHAGGVRRDSLLALLWPELSEARARGALSQILYRIRSALGDEALVSIGRDGVRLGDGCSCDATTFLDRIESDPIAALGIYAGDFLPGFHLTDSPAFDEWCETQRERFARLAAEAARRLAVEAEGGGDAAGAAAWLRRVLQVSPADETALRRLVEVLDRLGDRAGAVRAYEEFASRLARFYDLEPAPETVAVVESIRARRDPRRTDDSHAPARAGPETRTVAAPPATRLAQPDRVRMGAGLSAVAALALWMIGSVPSPQPSPRAGRLVVTDVDHGTAPAALGLAVREALMIDLGQSNRVEVVERGQLADVLARMRQPDTARIDERVALEIARREGYPAILSASVDRVGSGYRLGARFITATTGEAIVAIGETARTDDELISAVERLSRRLRRRVGESIAHVRASAPLPLLTTPSLEALTLLARARSSPRSEAIRLAEQAVLIDTSFAAAYYTLVPLYTDMGDPTRGDEYAELAYRYADRLTTIERLYVTGRYHDQHGWSDSAAWYRNMILDRDPSNTSASIGVGNDLTAMNRFDEALAFYRNALDRAPSSVNAHNKVVFTFDALGRGREADSVFALMRSRFPHVLAILNTGAQRAIRRHDLTSADSLISAMLRDSRPEARVWGHGLGVLVASMRGHLRAAIAAADAAADAADTRAAFGPQAAAAFLRSIAGAALAAGAPELALPAVERLEPTLTASAASLGGIRGLAVAASAYARSGRSGDAHRLLAIMDSVIAAKRLRTGASDEVRGILALHDGRYRVAVQQLERAKDHQYGVLTPYGQLALGEAYEGQGMSRPAAESYRALLDNVMYGYRTFYLGALWPLAHERLGRVHEMLGDTALAGAHLRTFVVLWQDADPEVSTRVEAARSASARLRSGGHAASGR